MHNESDVLRYYRKRESRYGYRAVLKGVRHFGYHEPPDRKLSVSRAQVEMERLLGRSIGLQPGSLLLDAGCGEGAVAHRLASEFGYNVVGIDIVSDSIRRARELPVPQSGSVRFEEMSYFSIADLQMNFDGIYTMETLVHADDPDQVLSSFRRHLRPGGRLVHLEYSMKPAHLLSAEELADFTKVNEIAAMPGWWEFTLGHWSQRLERLGFRNVHVRDITANMEPMLRKLRRLGFVPYWIASTLGWSPKVVNAMSAVTLFDHMGAWRYEIVTADG